MTSDTRAARPARGAKVLPGDARIQNRSLVLSHLFHHGPASRADLARATGLTRVTMSDLVSDLIGQDLVTELGTDPDGRPGKPGIRLGLRTDAHDIVALDLSDDTLLRGALVDLSGEIRERRSVPLGGRSGEEAFTAVRDLAAELVAASPRSVLGVGIATPGVVVGDGVVESAPNLGWYRLALGPRLVADLGAPLYVANDANAAILAETTFGGARAGWSAIVRIGHGVGAGIVAGGQLVRGRHGAAGELGHVTVVTDGLPCPCGRRGCLETILAVPALRARLAAVGGDETARAHILTEVGTALGEVLAPVISAFDLGEVLLCGPDEIVLGAFMVAARDTIARRSMPFAPDGVDVRTALLGEDVVLVGASALVISGRLGVS